MGIARRGGALGGIVVVVVACGESPVGPSPRADGGLDGAAGAVDAGDAGGAFACLVKGNPPLEGNPPSVRPRLCSEELVARGYRDCVGGAATRTACETFLAEEAVCARCLFGALPGDDVFAVPVPAVVRGADSPRVNEASCAALVVGRGDCTVPLARAETCASDACIPCAKEGQRTACEAFAREGECLRYVDAECEAAIATKAAEWLPVCRGGDTRESYAKVASYMCGG